MPFFSIIIFPPEECTWTTSVTVIFVAVRKCT
jgi:hypothetical protein